MLSQVEREKVSLCLMCHCWPVVMFGSLIYVSDFCVPCKRVCLGLSRQKDQRFKSGIIPDYWLRSDLPELAAILLTPLCRLP